VREPVAERVERAVRQELAVDHGRQRDRARVLVRGADGELGRRVGQAHRVGRAQHRRGILGRLAVEVVVVDQPREDPHVLRRPALRDLRRVDRVGGRALRDRPCEEPLGSGHREQGRHRVAARRLPEERDAVGVAAEGPDVPPHPLERGDLVAQSQVHLERMPRPRVRPEVEPAERAEPVVDPDVDDAVLSRHPLALSGILGGGAHAVRPAVDEHHDRARGDAVVDIGRGHVQAQAVLAAHEVLRRAEELPPPVLGRDRPEGGGVEDSVPRRGPHRGPEPQVAGRRGGVRDAAPLPGAPPQPAGDRTGIRLDHRNVAARSHPHAHEPTTPG